MAVESTEDPPPAVGAPDPDSAAAQLLPPDVAWCGTRGHRVLSSRFEVRWNSAELGDAFCRVFERFAVPGEVWDGRAWPFGWDLVVYSLLDREAAGLPASEDNRFALFRDRHLVVNTLNAAGLLDRAYWEVNHDVILNARDWLLVHAGAVVSPNGCAIVLPADSGSGKSSLVTALVRAGFGYLSDEFAPIDPVTRTLYGYPRPITLKEGSFAVFPDLAADGRLRQGSNGQLHVHAEDVNGTTVGGPRVIDMVIFPRYRADASTHVEPVSRALTLSRLIDNSPNFAFYGRRGMPVMEHVTRHAVGYSLEFSSVDDAVETVARLADSIPRA